MLSFTPDGKYLASVPFVPTNFPTHGDATRNKPVVIWELSTGKGIANVPAPGMKNIEWAAFSHGGKNLVSFDGDNLTLWAIAARRQIGQIPVRGFRSQIRPVLAPDGTSVMAVRSFGAGMRKPFPSAFFIDLDSGMKDLIFGEMPPREDPGAISLSPDGKILALGEHRKIALFDLLLDQEIQPLKRTFGNHSRGLSVLACSPDGRWLASAAGYPQHMGDLPDIPEVKLWDVRTGEEIACFHGDGGFIASLAFSPDGSRLLSGMWNGTILVWDVAAAARVLKPQAVDLSALELNALWQDLVGEDATKAYKALWALAAAPAKTVSLLKKELLPAAKASPEEIRQLIAALDSEKFSVRDRASQQLRALGSEVEVPLSQALNGNPSLEKRRRVEALLEAVMPKPSAVFRSRRGIQALEQIGTPEARQVLQSLADEMPTAVRTTEAKAALERLTRRTAAPSR
jgi:hypothetical protein